VALGTKQRPRSTSRALDSPLARHAPVPLGEWGWIASSPASACWAGGLCPEAGVTMRLRGAPERGAIHCGRRPTVGALCLAPVSAASARGCRHPGGVTTELVQQCAAVIIGIAPCVNAPIVLAVAIVADAVAGGPLPEQERAVAVALPVQVAVRRT
jgi:hypothetical protein